MGQRLEHVKEAQRMAEAKEAMPSKWLVLAPSIIGGIVAVAGIWSGYMVAVSGQRQQQTLEVSKLKTQILGSIASYEFRTAKMLLEHALKPIDGSASYAAFEKDFKELFAEKAPEAPSPTGFFVTGEGYGDSLGYGGASIGYVDSISLSEMVKEFRGPDRLRFSNMLVQHYEQQPKVVVDALTSGILPPTNKSSYRVNLYIAFTLARISTGWHGTREQWEAFATLKETKYYKDDSTFRRRVDEALANYKG